MINYESVYEIQTILQKYNISPQKKWGQNFMLSLGAREKLCTLLNSDENETVWEIGPGIGSLTSLLIEKAGNLIAFEIDQGFINILEDFYGNRETFSLVRGNFLKTWETVFSQQGQPDKIIGNLPYNSGSIMIGRLIEKDIIPEKMVFTVQKEVAQRMAASPGSKNYSAFSLVCQYRFRVKIIGDIKPGAFYPQPKVVSSIIQLIPHGQYSQDIDTALFFLLVHDAFRSRRKTLGNNLLGGNLIKTFGREKIFNSVQTCGIDVKSRGETISLNEYIKIVQQLTHYGLNPEVF